ncbi:VirB4 family type IV secretion/conjugal transfer ATPase [Acuticoccus sediminis]|uniref:VirB4 family type IV secretion/conjugal transfer ATPase n=1 Tax=Acuticoccus sediminis TaxID=2184697 RepID=UPI001CFCD8C3|nr:type IV secretion protein [Acuticoccus sediminis]
MLDVQRGHGRKAVEPEGVSGEHMLARHLPYVIPIGDDVVMLRDGDVMAAFMVDGIEALTAELAGVADLAETLGGIIAQAGPDVAFYVHRLSNPASVAMPAIEGDGFAAAVDRAWQGDLQIMGLRSRRIMVTVVVRPLALTSLWARISGGSKRDLMAMRERRITRLNEVVGHMMGALTPASPRRLDLAEGDWLGMLQACVSGIYRPLAPGAEFRPLADLMAASRVDFRNDTFVVFGNDADETRFGAIFTYKKYPTETQAGVFDGLDLPHDTVVTHSFTPIEQFEALARVQRTARQMRAADDAARSLEAQLVDAADDLASGRISFGLHQASITVFARSEAELDAVASRVRSAGQRTGGVVVREDIGARSAYFAQHPGNHSYRARAAMISSANFADFAALHANGEGLEPSRAPWGAPITTFRTLSHEPYRFSFHLAGSPGERTVGHTLIVGRTGSGKTAAIAFLMAQAQRIEPHPRIIAFDKDRGLEMALRALGGSYSAVRMGEQTGFNPFRAEGDARGMAWLTDWLSALLSQDGTGLSPMQAEALAQMTASNADSDQALQTISHFRSQLRSLDDDQDLYTRMAQWDEGGQYDWLFGGIDADPLHFANDVTGFDLTEVLDIPNVRTAWLSYVFRRIERTIEDGRPTLVVLDEAWKLLDDAYFQSRLKDWMLTMRKKNVAVVMLTQRVSHIAESRAGRSILESIATTILFPNSRNTEAELAPLGLTDGEQEFLTSSGAGHRYASIRSGDSSVFVDMDLSVLGPLLTGLVSGPGDETSPPGWRENPAFWKEL